MITFSIVTVCHNAQDSIEQTIKSVINQQYLNFEYILIDGNSSDNTLNIINKYKDSIDVIISEPDNGIYDAMNKGICLSKGQFVNFLNSGDTFFSSNTLELVKDYIKPTTDIISGDFNLVHINKKPKLIKTKKINWKDFRRDFYACHQAIFIKSSIINFYDLNYKIKADYKWVLDALSKSKEDNVVKIHKPIVNYNGDGFSSKNTLRNLSELLRLQKSYFGTFQLLLNLNIYFYRVLRDFKSKFI